MPKIFEFFVQFHCQIVNCKFGFISKKIRLVRLKSIVRYMAYREKVWLIGGKLTFLIFLNLAKTEMLFVRSFTTHSFDKFY